MRNWKLPALIVTTFILGQILFSISCLNSNTAQFNNNGLSDRDMELLLESFGGWFTRNDGQIDDPLIHFEFTSGNIVMSFRESSYSITLEKNGMKPSCVEIVFLGSNPVRPAGKEDPDHRSNYFYGSDPSGWFRNVPNYYEIVYPNIYDDIDLVFSTNDDGFKYEFLVNPGGDPDDIRV